MSRTRIIDQRERNSSYTMSDYNPGASSPSSVTTYSDGRFGAGSLRRIVDTITPGYRDLRRRGVVVMNPVEIYREDRTVLCPTWTAGGHPVWGSRVFAGNYLSWWKTEPQIPASYLADCERARNIAVTEAFKKMNSSESELIVTLAESRQTLMMLRRPFSTAIRNINSMIRRRDALSSTRDFASAASSAWLEYRLGWKPLIYDIQNIMKAYASTLEPIISRRRAARSSERLERNFRFSHTTQPAGTTSVTIDSTLVLSDSFHAGVLYELQDVEPGVRAAKNFGLTLDNVPSALWELVPLSFVVDRFLTVGDTLRAIVPNPYVKVVGSWVSQKSSITRQYSLVEGKITVNNSPVTTYYAPGAFYSESSKALYRTTNVRPDIIPSLTVGNLSVPQLADHVALIVSRLLSFSPRR